MKISTPKDLLGKYPDLNEKLNWRVQDIGVFLRCRLLRGYYDTKKRVSMIDEESLVELMEFADRNIDKQKVDI